MAPDRSIEDDPHRPVETYFAPAAREDPARVTEMARLIENNPLFQAILQSLDGFIIILNPQRQVLAVNAQLFEFLKIDAPLCLTGQRPGEVLGCIHADEGPGGCGTSKACATCGAVATILTSQETGAPATGECLATVRDGEHTESLEFRIRSSPVRVGGRTFTVLTLIDISGEKRREALERTFFHDIMNTVGGLMGWSDLMRTLDEMNYKEAATRILFLSRRLKQEIEDHRRLRQAEQGALDIDPQPVSAWEVLNAINPIFAEHPVAKGKRLELVETSPEESVYTDPSILYRVLTNMTKNALEACKEGETVRLWFERRDGDPTFLVHNPGVIPEAIALRIFQRSFSTKAQAGRGIGTYSMKLFGERYLGGEVAFASPSDGGTVFWIRLPAGGPPLA